MWNNALFGLDLLHTQRVRYTSQDPKPQSVDNRCKSGMFGFIDDRSAVETGKFPGLLGLLQQTSFIPINAGLLALPDDKQMA